MKQAVSAALSVDTAMTDVSSDMPGVPPALKTPRGVAYSYASSSSDAGGAAQLSRDPSGDNFFPSSSKSDTIPLDFTGGCGAQATWLKERRSQYFFFCHL